MQKLYVFVFACLATACPIFSQGEFILEIDRTTGKFTKVSPAIAGVEWIFPDDRAFDEKKGIFYFTTSSPTNALFGIDVANGSTLSSPAIPNRFYFEFDNGLNQLFCLSKNVSNDTKTLVSMNPKTGSVLPISSPLPGSSTFGGGWSAFNQAKHHYIFYDPSGLLYSIDVVSGAVAAQKMLALASDEILLHFAFDNATSALFGLIRNTTTQALFLVKIDPATGAVTKIGTAIAVGTGASSGSATIDEAQQHYIYCYFDADKLDYFVATLDLNSGQLLYESLLPRQDGEDNFFSVKFDNRNKKLYSIHWDAVILNTANPNLPLGEVKISPQPIREQAVLSSKIWMKNARLRVFNGLGQVVRDLQNLSGGQFQFFRDGLPSGAYFFRLEDGGRLLGAGKMFFIEF